MKLNILLSLMCVSLLIANTYSQTNRKQFIISKDQAIPTKLNDLKLSNFSSSERKINDVRKTKSTLSSVNPIALGSATNVWTIIDPDQNQIAVDNSTGLVVFVHRNNHNKFGGNSGHLRYDFSTDFGLSWHNDIGPINPLQTELARYPNIALFKPDGVSSPTGQKAVVIGPTINNNLWKGFMSSFAAISENGDPSPAEFYSSQTDQYYGMSGICKRINGEYWFVIPSLNANGWFTGAIKVFKGSHNGTDITWTENNSINATLSSYSQSFIASIMSLNICFSPDGQTGWISFLGDLEGGRDSVVSPCFIKSTDGGASWGSPYEYDLNTEQWVADSLQKFWVIDSLGTPASTGLATATFECDLTVDSQGNPHLLLVVGSADFNGNTMPPSYSIFSGFEKFTCDLTTPNGGTTWTPKYISPVLSFRHTYIGASESLSLDNQLQIARNPDGTKIFFSWVDSDTTGGFFGSSENEFPNLAIAALNIANDYQTYPIFVTHGDANWDGKIISPTMAPEVIEQNGRWNLPIVFAEMSTGDPLDSAFFHYLGVDAQICEDAFMDPASISYYWPDIQAYTPPICFALSNNQVISTKSDLQIFPNPASVNVSISFSLSQKSNVSLDIMNAQGQHIETVLDQKLSDGNHTLDFNISDFANGIYFCKLYYNDDILVKKFIISR
ncbi:MAG: T9SS type A sorting domain-containing protein [Bacteroidales bacterium]|nr:T9SS type A sorting domain-containing protein [Bacteroidales bacterium]MCF8456398.1 T9SS type A sorting domain-containing protein [Bacteroidales bacterium]